MFANTWDYGIRIYDGQNFGNTIRNNIFISREKQGMELAKLLIFENPGNSKFENNLFYYPGGDLSEKFKWDTAQFESFDDWQLASSNINNNIWGEPLFVNQGSYVPEVYKLESGSPAIDAGTTGADRDFNGVSRPQGAGWDIGAFEKSSEPCIPNCHGRECGNDSCGGSCGTCSASEECANNQCVSRCIPNCQGKECGDDDCGGLCGSCQSGYVCSSNTCVPSSSSGETYYFNSVSGSNSNSGLSEEQAWRDFNIFFSKNLEPGDTIKLKSGQTFQGELIINDSGTQSNPITVTSYGTGPKPIISHVRYQKNAVIIRANWIIVENLKIVFLPTGEKWLDAGINIEDGFSNNIIRNNEITNTGSGITIRGSNNLVTNNNIHDLIMVVNDKGTNCGQPEASNCDNDWGATAIWFKGTTRNNEVSYNTMKSCIADSYDYDSDGGAIEWWLPSGAVSENNRFHHNYVEDCDGVFEVGGRGGTLKSAHVYHNVFVDTGKVCWMHLVGGQGFGVTVEEFTVNHNTFYEKNTDPKYLSRNDDYFLGFGGEPGSNVKMKNNIFYVDNPEVETMVSYNRDVSGMDASNNIYYIPNGRLNMNLKPGELNVDPEFVSQNNGNFHLKFSSLAVDAGADLGYTFDFEDNPIPVGEGYDIGAYEYR